MLDKMGTTESFSHEFVNHLWPDFKATINYSCFYKHSAQPVFGATITPLEVETVGVSQEWELPEIVKGSLPFSSLKFEADPLIAPYLSLVAPAHGANQMIYKISYNGEVGIMSINGQ